MTYLLGKVGHGESERRKVELSLGKRYQWKLPNAVYIYT